jgi:hypothetical protein
VLLSRLIRFQPLGGLIETLPANLACTEARRTSPAAVDLGRATVSVEPEVVSVTTAPGAGNALSARPDPEIVTPRKNASATKGRWRRSRLIQLNARLRR